MTDTRITFEFHLRKYMEVRTSQEALPQRSPNRLERALDHCKKLLLPLLAVLACFGPANSQAETQESPEEIAQNNPYGVIKSIRQILFELQLGSLQGKLNKEKVEGSLADIEKWLERLKKAHGNVGMINTTSAMAADLRGDCEIKGVGELRLDTSLEYLIDKWTESLEKQRVKRAKPSQVSRKSKKVLQKVRATGEKVEYIVRPEKPNGKIILLYGQVHPTPLVTDEINREFTENHQDQLSRQLEKLIEAGVIDTIYAEGGTGLIDDEMITKAKERAGKNPQLSWLAVESLARKQGKLKVVGVETPSLLAYVYHMQNQLIEAIKTGTITSELAKQAQKNLEFRAGAHNSFIAYNIHEGMASSDEKVAAVVFGLAHEWNVDGDTIFKDGAPHPLPLSKILAGIGYEVFVMKHVDLKAAQELIKKIHKKSKEDPKGTYRTHEEFEGGIRK